jgi:hypothetical protein
MSGSSARAANEPDGYPALVTLFQQWREFEHPAMKNNVPDYSASAMAAKAAALPQWRKRLDAIDPKLWPIEQQNDYKLVKAEMNGLDFNLRVLRPWARDPAFYVNVFSSRSDIPWREGPVPYPEIELYKYHFPLGADAQKDLTTKIGMIPAFLSEAKENLKESNARDLWVYGAQELRNQSTTLQSLEDGTLTVRTLAEHQQADLNGTSPQLRAAVAKSIPQAQIPAAAAWSPLAVPAFRMIWVAVLITNIGGWMASVATAWLMTSLDPSPLMVSLVSAAIFSRNCIKRGNDC